MKTILLLTALMVLLSAGCKSPKTTAYNTTAIVGQTVDALMETWGDYVATGKATYEQRLKVKKAHDAYIHSQLAMGQAIESVYANPEDRRTAFKTVTDAVVAAEKELVILINTIVPPSP